MSHQSSRLHALERGLKAPRKSRVKARALTVMRLEDGAIGGQRSTRPARLPKDMEDQIAVVRGRAVGKPSRGLLQLEERLLRTNGRPASAAIQRHDHGAPRVSVTPASQARALSNQMSGHNFGGHYSVESFEDNSATTAGLPMPLSGSQLAVTTAPGTFPGSAVARASAFGVVPRTQSDSARGLSEHDRDTRRRALAPDQKDIAAGFERDVAAMLDTPAPAIAPEDQQWDKTVRNAAAAPGANAPASTAPAGANAPAVSAPPGANAPAATTPETTTAPAPKQNTHELFNQMGLAMNYANSFDLGAMDLSSRFDRFDEELALASKTSSPTSPAPVSVQAFALNDFDLVEDLAEISSARTAPAATTDDPQMNSYSTTKKEAPSIAP